MVLYSGKLLFLNWGNFPSCGAIQLCHYVICIRGRPPPLYHCRLLRTAFCSIVPLHFVPFDAAIPCLLKKTFNFCQNFHNIKSQKLNFWERSPAEYFLITLKFKFKLFVTIVRRVDLGPSTL